MITVANQTLLSEWLCDKIGLVATPNMRCIGRLSASGKIMGVVGFDGYNGASVMMHVAGEGNWINREMLRACFDYPYNIMRCKVVLGMVPSGNVQAMKLNLHLGFKVVAELRDAHPDGSAWIISMYRDECRWLIRGMEPEATQAMQPVLH